jgi:hypothetical protein
LDGIGVVTVTWLRHEPEVGREKLRLPHKQRSVTSRAKELENGVEFWGANLPGPVYQLSCLRRIAISVVQSRKKSFGSAKPVSLNRLVA